ncbi:caspase family protein [Streptomyces sp. S465]|uniref:caspase family protein n=1 Tax=Streptomyces sp. S465 TaxID=2979468 RepID=UPI0022A84706|nr:caspase family protein [Streptomyces sp. S465]WAP54973.1 caspase family protein [Streptomyces sp. S465]
MLVGIGDYTHADLAAMPAAATGAGHLARLLRDPLIWGLPHEHVTILGTDTTQERILTTVRDAALAAEDTLVVYFAGHGLRDPGERLHLALVDADPDYPQIGTLPYRQLRDLIRQAGHRAKHRVTILDCCYSGIAGGMSHPTAPTRDDLAAALDEHAHANATDGDDGGRHGSDENGYGDCVLTSAPPQSRSFVRPGAPLPEFTGELITTLEAGITGVGPAISLEHVWLRIRDRMRGRDSPEPQLFAQNNATRHIHFLNRAPHDHGEQGAAPDPDPGPSAAHLVARDAAEHAARAIPDRSTSMGLLARIAAATVTVDPDKARQLADEVIQAGHEITDLSQRARLLTAAATCLVALDPPRAQHLVDEAEGIIQGITDIDAKVFGLARLATAVTATDRDRATWLLEKAEEALHSLPDTRYKADRLRSLSFSVLDDEPEWRQRLKDDSEHLEKAIRQRERFEEDSRRSPEGLRRAGEVRANNDPRWRVVELVKIARDLADSRHYHQAVELLEEAEQTVRKIGLHERGEALSELTGALSRVCWAARTIPNRVIDLMTRVRNAVNGFADQALGDRLTDVGRTLADVAGYLAETDPHRAVGLIREVQTIAPQLPGRKQRLLDHNVARALPRVGMGLAPLDAEQAATLAHEAMAIVRTLDNDLTEKQTLREAVSVLALAGQHLARADPRRADELLGESESFAQRLPERDRTHALNTVVGALVDAGNAIAGTDPDRVDRFVRKSERLMRSLPDENRRFHLDAMARVLVATGEALVGSEPDRAVGCAREAERIVRQLPRDEERAAVLWSIAGLQAELVKRRPAYADRARRTAESITDDLYKAIAVHDLALALAPADTDQAERIARNITDAYYRASALAAIAEARL